MQPPPIRAYPDWLEQAWLKRFDARAQTLETAVQALSDRFTVGRAGKFDDYFADKNALAAYGCFFFPQSWARARIALAEVLELRGWNGGENPKILDVGAGPGASGIAASQLLRERGGAKTVRITGLDHSPRALECFAGLIRENQQHLSGISFEKSIARSLPVFLKKQAEEEGPYDLIIAGFALNEVWGGMDVEGRVAYILRLKRMLVPGGLLLVLEPALRETATALQEVSDAVSQKKLLHRWGPYWGEFPCPVLGGAKYWPHEVRVWAPPPSLKDANRHLWRQIGELKFHWAAWSDRLSRPLPSEPVPMRLSTPFAKLKGRFEWAGVLQDGRLVRCDMPLRGLDRAVVDECEKIERGDTLFLSAHETLEENRWRMPSPESIARRYSPR